MTPLEAVSILVDTTAGQRFMAHGTGRISFQQRRQPTRRRRPPGSPAIDPSKRFKMSL